MANPTGTAYLNAEQNYVWQDGDVYEIPWTDTVEAAADGASFNGLGVANQPHQKLLDKFELIHKKQLADEDSIANLQSTLTTITSDVGTNGWIKLGSIDTSRGSIQFTVQWGTINLLPYGRVPFSSAGAGQPGSGYLPASLPLTFPIPFTTSVWLLQLFWRTVDSRFWMGNQGNTGQQFGDPSCYELWVEPPYQLSTNNIIAGIDDDDLFVIYSPYNVGLPFAVYNGITGINWIAFGY